MQEQEASYPVKSWYKNWWGILIILFFAVIVAGLALFGFSAYQIGQKIQSGQLSAGSKIDFSGQKKYDAENKSSYWTGAPDPKVTIVEFADFACPNCEKSFTTIRAISVKYRKDVKLIFRDYPLLETHSIDLASAARCAGEQGKFWPMHDKLFMNQGMSTTTQLEALAQQTGINMAKYKECYRSKKYHDAIYKDVSDASDLGIVGTPTWFVNGYKLEGDVPLDVWENIINQLINTK